MADGPVLRTAAVVFAVALVIRLFYLAEVWRCPIFQSPTLDASAYYTLALEFARGHWLSPTGEPYWQPAFYSMVVALWMKLVGTSVFGVKLVQFVLGAVNCSLIYVLGTRVFNRGIGLIAGLAAALYGPMIYFDGELLTPALQIFLNLCALLVLLDAVEKDRAARFALAGLLIGFSIITRPDALLFLPGALAWTILCLRATKPVRHVVGVCLVMVTCAVLPVIPGALRNLLVGHDPVLIAYNGGINFYIGNNAREEWTRAIRPGPDWDLLKEWPRREIPGASPSRQSAFFYGRALDYILTHPLAYAGLLGKKTIMYLTGIEGRRNDDQYFYRNYSRLYSVLTFKFRWFAFPYGIVLPLALLGILRWRPDRRRTLCYWYLGAQFLGVIAFFVTSRYRIPAIPVLLLFAAFGATELISLVTRRQWRTTAWPLCALAGSLVLSNANLYAIDHDTQSIEADNHLCLANILATHGQAKAAEEHCTQSIALNPDYEVSRYFYALFLIAQDRDDEANQQLLECLRITPGSVPAHLTLGELCERAGDPWRALAYYESAARTNSAGITKLASLAEHAYDEKDYRLAEAAIRPVVQIMPDSVQARRTLGVLLIKKGLYNDAIAELQAALKLAPGSADVLIDLAIACDRAGKYDEARTAVQRALRIDPQTVARRRMEADPGSRRQ